MLGFVYRWFLTNLLGDIGNGIYSGGYYLYMFFLILSSAGLPAAISKMTSVRLTLKQYKNAHEVFRTSLIVASVSGFVGMTALFLGARWLSEFNKSPLSYHSLLTLAPTILIVAIVSVYRGYFQGMNNTVPTALSQIIEQVFNAVFSVVLAYMLIGRGVEFGAAGGTAGTGVGAFAGLVVMFLIYLLAKPAIIKNVRADKSQPESRRTIAKELVGIAVPIIIGTAIFSITNLIDVNMVMSILTTRAGFSETDAYALYGQLTGKYGTLVTMPVAISTSLATAAIPSVAASFAAKDGKTANEKIFYGLWLAMSLSIPAAVGMGVLGDQILFMLFPKYPSGGLLIKYGAASIIFLALAQITTGMLQAVGKVHVPAIAAFFGAVIKIPLNIIFISNPKVNVLGAVISTIFCYMVAAGIDLVVLCRTLKTVPDLFNLFVKPLFASAIMGAACYVQYYFIYWLLGSNTVANTVAVLVSVFFGIAVYFLSLYFMNGLPKSIMNTINRRMKV